MDKRQVYEGDWIKFTTPAVVLECCFCGYTHVYLLRHDSDGVPHLQAYVDMEASQEAQANMPKKQRQKILRALGKLK